MNSMISVIIPCYKQAHFLKDSLGSLLAQSYRNWEAIIVDDGSPDNVREAVQAVGPDARFRYLRKENGGLSSARNFGLRAVQGDFIQFLDADDFLCERKFEHDIDCLSEASSPDIVVSDYQFLTSEGRLLRNRFSEPRFLSPENALIELIIRWETDLSIPVHSFLFKAHIFTSRGLFFDESLPNHEDWDMWVRVFSDNPTIRHVASPAAIYRVGTSSMSRNTSAMYDGFIQAIRALMRNPAIPKYARSALRQKIKITQLSYHMGFRGRAVGLILSEKISCFLHWRIRRFIDRYRLGDMRYQTLKVLGRLSSAD